jgi:hypothetical protein
LYQKVYAQDQPNKCKVQQQTAKHHQHNQPTVQEQNRQALYARAKGLRIKQVQDICRQATCINEAQQHVSYPYPTTSSLIKIGTTLLDPAVLEEGQMVSSLVTWSWRTRIASATAAWNSSSYLRRSRATNGLVSTL